jgi:hypothetical protein
MKQLIYTAAMLAATSFNALAQQINISWDNITYSDNTFSFDVVFQSGTGYSSLTAIDGANLRFIITTSNDLDVTSVEATSGGAFSTTGAAGGPELSPLPEGASQFQVVAIPSGTTDPLSTGEPVTVATVTVSMSGTIPDDAFFTLLPPPPPGETAGPYSFWTYGDVIVMPFVGDFEMPLPVEFVNFTAQAENNGVALHWATAKEQNNKGFDIERSINGKAFTKIAHVSTKAVNGNSTALLNYNFTDAQPHNGVNYYRLKQLDIDGKYVYSTVASVTLGSEQSLSAYPNPTKDLVKVDGLNVGYVVRVFDVNGRKVAEQIATATNETLDLSNLAAGIYTLQIQSNNTAVKSMQVVKK